MADEPDLRPWLLGVSIAMAILAVLLTSLRIRSRTLLQQKLWHDDYLILASTATNLVCAALILAMCTHGLGQPDTSSVTSPSAAKLYISAEVVYAWTLCLAKLSVLVMYYRVFDEISRTTKALLGGLAAFVVLWSCASSFLFLFTCAPVHKLWVPDTPGQCIRPVGRWIANASSTIITDMAIILLPVPQLLRTTLTRLEKIGVTVVFAQAFCVVFASVYRFALLFSYSPTNKLYTLAPTIGWMEIELAVAIVAANLPVLQPLLASILLSFGYRGSYHEQQQLSQTTFFSGGSGRSRKRLPADTVNDAWAWNETSQGNVRPVELFNNQHLATASRGRDSEMIQVPLYGISVTKEFRRCSAVVTS